MDFISNHWGNPEFYQLIKGYPGGIIIFALNGDILEVNEQFAQALECTPEQIYQHSYSEISDETSQATEAELLKAQAFATGRTEIYDKKYCISNQKTFIIKQHVFLIRDNAGQPQFFLAMLPPDASNGAQNGRSSSVDADTVERELVFLKTQNAELQSMLKKATEKTNNNPNAIETSSLSAHNDQLKAELTTLRDSEKQLSRKITAMTQTLDWKEKTIHELEATQGHLEAKLAEAKGELEVIRILETEKEKPPVEEPDELPLPWDVADMKFDDSVLDENANPLATPKVSNDVTTSEVPSIDVVTNEVTSSDTLQDDPPATSAVMITAPKKV